MSTFKTKYGLNWPANVEDPFIDLILAKKWMLEPFKRGNLLDPGEHLLRAIRALFTPEQWKISPWTEEHAHAWASEEFSVWLGGASCSKAQPLDAPVQTPHGPRPIGSLVPGDFVLGLHGTPTRVTAVRDAGEQEVWRVTAEDGRSALCAPTHLWAVDYALGPRHCVPTYLLDTRLHRLPHTRALGDAQGRRIAQVGPVGLPVPMRCITVAASDGIYLTRDFLPTHNSNDAGGFAVLDWITDPRHTYIALASTSVPMLRLRSFESVIRYFRILKAHPRYEIPGKESVSQTAIINEDDDDTTDKASVRGVALADGDEARAVARLAGSHLPFVTMILDEGAALPPAAANARFNARAGTRRFRFLSLANPIDRYDEATKFCAPIGGWSTVDENTGRWRSQYGLVLHHNGFNSPAIKEPEEYPFLINQEQLDAMLRETGGNRDDPMIWRMAIGFPAPVSLEHSVLSANVIESFRAHDTVVWLERPAYRVAGLDPAFTTGGDKCILQVADVGLSSDRVQTISFLTPIQVPLETTNPRPVEYQISDYVREQARVLGFSIRDLAVDDSGTQSIASIIQQESGTPPIRVNFGAKPLDTPTPTAADPKPRARYRNRVTELWYRVAKLVREGRVRGLPQEAAQQFCSRRYRRDLTPLALESKVDYKERHQGRSPDEADALSLAVAAAERYLTVEKVHTPRRNQPRELSVGYTDNVVDVDRYRGYTGGNFGA